MFATGIENSIPTIKNGKIRVDQMEACGHYEKWREDFDCVQDIGINYLRYGPPIHKTYLGPGKYDWEFADITFAELRRRDITPIVDLCHFGVPDWIGHFQNPDFPQLFAQYASAFAERFPWVQLYTPVNEMFICAIFSAKYGWWNEQLKTDKGFVTALKHIVKANVLAMLEILKHRADAIFIQSESSEYFHADSPAAIHKAELMNSRRFLSLDLNYGRRVDSDMYEYLMDNGMTKEEYHFFLSNRLKQHCILGNDYYRTNEHRVFENGQTTSSGEVFGYTEITRQYYNRYRLPIMHTETKPGRRTGRRRIRALAVEGMGQRPSPAQRRHPDRRLHLVFAHRPGRLGHGASGAKRQRQRARPVRSRPQYPQRRPRL
jgi:beta-glucosidase